MEKVISLNFLGGRVRSIRPNSFVLVRHIRFLQEQYRHVRIVNIGESRLVVDPMGFSRCVTTALVPQFILVREGLGRCDHRASRLSPEDIS